MEKHETMQELIEKILDSAEKLAKLVNEPLL